MKAEVLVVHCVDTEGPIGGDVRRRPDGSKEFMDNWRDISVSIRRLTRGRWRAEHADSFDRSYLFNWFIMDFMGFATNPKRRVQKYHDTYDHFKKLRTELDGFYWHYHHPPAHGAGDQWSGEWGSSQAYLNILLHRLVEREDWPEAYRAGGTIEDNQQSRWLEDHMMLDYSNRVSNQSLATSNIFDFNWAGAPKQWGYYHPNESNFLQPGNMRRFIVRSVDLWSRLHVLTVEEVREAFRTAQANKTAVILSYFSHDHRDMFDETIYAISLVKQVSKEMGIPWRVCTALEALQRSADIKPVGVRVKARQEKGNIYVTTSRPIYQPAPWVGAKLSDDSLAWLPVKKRGTRTFEVTTRGDEEKIVVGGTSLSGNKFIHTL